MNTLRIAGLAAFSLTLGLASIASLAQAPIETGQLRDHGGRGGTRTAAAKADAVAVRDGAGDAAKGGIQVLNCSQSAANPVTIDLSTGKPGWTLKLPSGAASAILPTPAMVPSPWTAVPGAQWVGPKGAPQLPGNYVYEVQVRVLKCPQGQPAKLTAQFRADNVGTLTLLDPAGAVIATMNQAGTPNYGFLPASLSPAGAPTTHAWAAPANGVYTIRMTVRNSGGPTGTAVNAVLTR